MEEGVLVVADVDEGGLEAGVEVLDAALVDAADHAGVGFALDLEAVEGAVDEERHALLQRLGIDDEFAEGAFFLAEHAEDFLQERPVGGAFLGFGFQLFGREGRRVLLLGRLGELVFIAGGVRGGASGRGLIVHGGVDALRRWLSAGLPWPAGCEQEIPAERSISRGQVAHGVHESLRKR